MDFFIRSIASVSPFSHPAVSPFSNALVCADPDLNNIIDPKLSRRMSHVIKMGIGAAMQAMQQADNITPDAIITGTAYGCLDDTGIFLKKQVLQQETMLTPTSFIQSTHNTVGGQIGLLLHCNGYNNTFVHRGFSFEHALQDAMMLLEENNAMNVLVGAVDEITPTSHTLLSRFGIYKKAGTERAQPTLAKGAVAGEGAHFFVLSSQQHPGNHAILKEVSTLFKPTVEKVKNHILSMLTFHQLQPGAIDVILAGKNGDAASDKLHDEVLQSLFPGNRIVTFKEQSGEYPTATGFALWKAATMIHQENLPEAAFNSTPVKNILVYNHYQNLHHTFYLVSAC